MTTKRLGLVLAVAMVPGWVPALAWAEGSYIRLEAWRGTEAANAAAARWAADFPDVVTFPLPGGWVAVGIGPVEGGRAEAGAQLDALKARRAVPRDAFVTDLDGEVAVTRVTAQQTGSVPDASTAEAGAEAAPAPAADAPARAEAPTDQPGQPETPAAGEPAPAASVPTAPVDTPADAPAADQPAPDAPATIAADDAANLSDLSTPDTSDTSATPDDTTPEPAARPLTYIRLEAFQTRDEAGAALTRWRARLPAVSLWELPSGWYGLAYGPLTDTDAAGWRKAWQDAGRIPSDAFAVPEADLGTALDRADAAPDLAPPPAPAQMPPLDQVQDALRWAGHYTGEIDGKTGPLTRAAIAAEMEAEGADSTAPDAQAVAMIALMDRRAAWREAMNLTPLEDSHTGLRITVPIDRLEFLRTERGLSIYGPKDGSGAALILFSQPGGRAEMTDIAGLVTALGWVPHPERRIEARRFTLDGANDTHISHAEGRIRDGVVEGFVLIWPAADAENAPRLAEEASASLSNLPPEPDPEAEAEAETE